MSITRSPALGQRTNEVEPRGGGRTGGLKTTVKILTILLLASLPALPQDSQMQRLSRAFAGTWSITVKDEPMPDSPKAEAYSGQEIWTDPGGGPVMEQFHAKPSTGDQDETALFWWDAKAQKYGGLWCAPINDEGCNGFEAGWDGDQFVCEGQWEYHGKRLTWREVFLFPTPNSFLQTLYIGGPGSKQNLASTIHAARVTSRKP